MIILIRSFGIPNLLYTIIEYCFLFQIDQEEKVVVIFGIQFLMILENGETQKIWKN